MIVLSDRHTEEHAELFCPLGAPAQSHFSLVELSSLVEAQLPSLVTADFRVGSNGSPCGSPSEHPIPQQDIM